MPSWIIVATIFESTHQLSPTLSENCMYVERQGTLRI